MCLKQLLQADTCVNLSGVEFFMAKDGLNRANVGSILVHQGGHGVTEDVTRSRFLDASGFDVTATVLGQRIRIDGFAIDGQKQCPLFRING